MGIDEHGSSWERTVWGRSENFSCPCLEAAQLGVGKAAFWVAILESRGRADCCPIGYGRPSLPAFKSCQAFGVQIECQSGTRLKLAGVLARHGGRTRLVWWPNPFGVVMPTSIGSFLSRHVFGPRTRFQLEVRHGQLKI